MRDFMRKNKSGVQFSSKNSEQRWSSTIYGCSGLIISNRNILKNIPICMICSGARQKQQVIRKNQLILQPVRNCWILLMRLVKYLKKQKQQNDYVIARNAV